MSRTIAGSGSARQRSVGRTRSRVSTYVTGALDPAVAASRVVRSVGATTTSAVGAEPDVDLGEADRRPVGRAGRRVGHDDVVERDA